MRGRRSSERGSHDLFVLLHSTQAERRRRRGHWVVRVIFASVIVAAALGLAGYGLMQAGRILFVENPFFRIRELDLHSDGRLRPQHLMEYTGLRPGMGIFAVNFESVAAALRSVPLVADVKIVRHLPDRLEVAVTERVPLARMVQRRGLPFYAVDAEGCVLAPTYGSSTLPVIEWQRGEKLVPGRIIRDPRVRDALYLLDLVRKDPELEDIRPQRISVEDPEVLDLQLSTGTRVLVSRVGLEERLRKVAAILRTCRLHRRELPVFIDATVDGDYPARFR